MPVPQTVMVRTDVDLKQLLYDQLPQEKRGYLAGMAEQDLKQLLYDQLPQGWDGFKHRLDAAADVVGGYPCFLRTGHTSGKHCWRDTCYLARAEDIVQRVGNLVEYSATCSIPGLPTDVWAVRELLPTEPICELPRYYGMPLCREFRCFIRGGGVLCVHPYWPWDAVVKGFDTVPDGLFEQWRGMCDLELYESTAVRDIGSRVSDVLDGEWSVDILWTSRGWYVIDMALAEDSFHWPTCERIGKDD